MPLAIRKRRLLIPVTRPANSLDWSDASGASYYNVYRSAVSGGPYTLVNIVPDLSSAFIDATMVSGTIYYYVVTQVDVNGFESAYSSEVSSVAIEAMVHRTRSPFIYY